MGEEIKKHPLNVRGKYYVTEDCLLCENCQIIAPNNFRYDEEGLSYVCKQPDTPGEEAQCREAVHSCPMEAIRDDGVS